MDYLNIFDKFDNDRINDFKDKFSTNKNLLNQVNVNGSSLLHISIKHGDLLFAKFLIDNSININIQDKKGATPLHYCAEYNQYDIAAYILRNNGKLDIADKYGNEPLWTATFNVRKDLTGLDIVKLFLEKGANKNHLNKVNKSPASFAQQINFQPIVNLMAEYN